MSAMKEALHRRVLLELHSRDIDDSHPFYTDEYDRAQRDILSDDARYPEEKSADGLPSDDAHDHNNTTKKEFEMTENNTTTAADIRLAVAPEWVETVEYGKTRDQVAEVRLQGMSRSEGAITTSLEQLVTVEIVDGALVARRLEVRVEMSADDLSTHSSESLRRMADHLEFAARELDEIHSAEAEVVL